VAQPSQPAPQTHHQPEKVLDEPEAPKQSGGFGWGVLAFFIPIVGLILWLVWRHSKPAASRGSRNGFIVGMVVYVLMSAAGVYAFLNLGFAVPFLPAQTTANEPLGTPTATDTGSWPEGTKTRVFLMNVGDCFNYDDLSGTGSQYAWVVDCTSPHDTEVFATGQITDTDYPTAQGWADWGAQICEAAFTDYVGVPWYQSVLVVYHLYPDEQTWNDEPTIRQMTCVAQDTDGGLTNSVKGTNQ